MQEAARIVHVTADYPDPVEPAKTPVVRDLLALADGSGFRHEVISLNRKPMSFFRLLGDVLTGGGKPALLAQAQAIPGGMALSYHAPSRGLYHATMLGQLGDWLAAECRQATMPDLLWGHKLTVEGIAVRRAARHLGLRFGITIQGNTDTKILRARPDLANRFRQIWHEAAVLVAFAPWALRTFEERFGPRHGPTFLVPCPTDLDAIVTPRPGDGRLVSVFHLRNWHTKNLDRLADAQRLLARQGQEVPLDVLGGGTAAEEQAARQAAGDAPLLRFGGGMARDDLRARLNAATGFVLPSRRETFGLVFIEALLAGLPIVYPRGRAIDGYFDGLPFAIAVDPANVEQLAQAMRRLVDEEAELKDALAQWQRGQDPTAFQRPAIAAQFAAALAAGLERTR